MLEPSNNPLYKQLHDTILQEIKNKKYKQASKLPSENELSKTHNVNRQTIRKSLQLLKDEGHIYTKKGVGNFITTINIPYSITDKSSYSKKISDLGFTPRTVLLNTDIIKANEQITTNLGLHKDAKVIELELLRYADDLPIQVSYHYFDAFIYKKIIDNLDLEPFSLYKILEHCYPDLEMKKVSTLFESLISSQKFCNQLNIPRNTPILSVQTVSKDQNQNFVEYGINYFRGDLCKIKVDLIGDK